MMLTPRLRAIATVALILPIAVITNRAETESISGLPAASDDERAVFVAYDPRELERSSLVAANSPPIVVRAAEPINPPKPLELITLDSPDCEPFRVD